MSTCAVAFEGLSISVSGGRAHAPTDGSHGFHSRRRQLSARKGWNALRVGAPYPVFLALGGALLAFVPVAASFTLPPELALTLQMMDRVQHVPTAINAKIGRVDVLTYDEPWKL